MFKTTIATFLPIKFTNMN